MTEWEMKYRAERAWAIAVTMCVLGLFAVVGAIVTVHTLHTRQAHVKVHVTATVLP